MISSRSLLAVCTVSLAVTLIMAHGGGYNPSNYPGLVNGFSNNFLSYQPSGGYLGCKYWCRSTFTRQYYCCSNVGAGGIYGGGGGFGGGGLGGGLGGGHRGGLGGGAFGGGGRFNGGGGRYNGGGGYRG